MTNVPGVGFVLLLAAAASIVALPALAGASLLVTSALDRDLAWTLLGVHAAAILGAVALAVGSSTGLFQDAPLGAAFGLLRFTLGVLLAGLLVATVAEGVPIGLGALLTVLFVDASRERALWYATAGYASGGVGGALAGVLLTGRVEAAVAGALLATPAALGSACLETAAARLRRPESVS
ncbi:hypothetical protein [Halobellus sp. GM3]|uniref:hypothetical protein n=1 Tax=Halobellus sp. GM3 TaxID=3458410 RepID=UPI00403E1ADC